MIGALFEAAITTGVAVEVEDASGVRSVLPVPSWEGTRSGADAGLITRCRGATLDIGCGPGRFVAELAELGVPALCIDVTPAAVERARAGGALALQRDVFGPLPGDGRWHTVLLVDGNIGIGGDPLRLLRRVACLLCPGGQALVELSGPGRGRGTFAVRLRTSQEYGNWFRWAEVGHGDLAELSAEVGLRVLETWDAEGRWFACLG